MKKIIRLTESDLNRIVRRVLHESMWTSDISWGKLTTKDDKPKRGRPVGWRKSDKMEPPTDDKESETKKVEHPNLYQNQEKKEKYKSEIADFIKSNNITTRTGLRWGHPTLYQRALRYKLLDDLFSPKKTEEELKQEIIDFIKENDIKYRHQLSRLSSTLYSRAREWGLLDDLFPPDQRFKKNK